MFLWTYVCFYEAHINFLDARILGSDTKSDKNLYCCFIIKTHYSYFIMGKLGKRCEGAGVGEGDQSKWNQGEIIKIT